jgi:glycine/D-amino acid oxidase-like deaminating enzyme
MADFIVVGAGVIGSALAYYLTLGGAQVSVVEQARPGAGTSSTTFSWLNANNKTPREYFELNYAGLRVHLALEQQLGEAPWLHHGGNIEWAGDAQQAAELEAKVGRLRSWGYRADWLSPEQLRELQPGARINTGEAGRFVYFPQECWLDPLPLIHRLLNEAEHRGAELLRTRVSGILTESGRAGGVLTADGQRLEAGGVVCCAGRWAADLVATSGFALPTANTAGLLALTAPAATGLSCILHAPHINIRPDGAGRLLLAAEDIDEGVTFDTAAMPGLQQCEELLRRATEVLPDLGGTPVEAARLGIRPIPADGLTTAGPIPGIERGWMVVTHSGATMCLALGRMIAGELLGGDPSPELAAFRPGRFATAGV